MILISLAISIIVLFLQSFIRKQRITLASTRVLECKRALTGLGLSIALKSQGKYINCADLEEIANSNSRLYEISFIWVGLVKIINKQISLTRLDSSLTTANERASCRLLHQLTKRYELILKNSQKIKKIILNLVIDRRRIEEEKNLISK